MILVFNISAAPMTYRGNNSFDDSCQWADMMGKAVEASGTYLYPCTIEYSLMCAGECVDKNLFFSYDNILNYVAKLEFPVKLLYGLLCPLLSFLLFHTLLDPMHAFFTSYSFCTTCSRL